jgi:hypothetical protein
MAIQYSKDLKRSKSEEALLDDDGDCARENLEPEDYH